MFKDWDKENQKPKILFVDDEEVILTSIIRIFRNSQLDIHIANSAQKAQQLVNENDYWVVVSDYRMPGLNGAELLQWVKQRRPLAARVLMTAFLEKAVIEDAINKAAIFRFVSKPWNEEEFRISLQASLSHSKLIRDNERLTGEFRIQNSHLEELTQNLEAEVVRRTESIEESRKLAEVKQRRVRELTRFVNHLSGIKEISDLFLSIHHEIRKFQILRSSMLVVEGDDSGELFTLTKDGCRKVEVSSISRQVLSASLRTNSETDREFWGQHIDRTLFPILGVPIMVREQTGSNPAAVLLLEYQGSFDELSEIMDHIVERIQPVSVVLDNILLHDQLTEAAQQWEATFNGFRDPIAVVDQFEKVIRANKSFLKGGRTYCYEMLDGRDDLCVNCPMPAAILSMEPASQIVHTQSTKKAFRVQSYPVTIEEGGHPRVGRLVNHYRDVSRERQLFTQLIQSEKMAAVGLLAGNVAHELNNPLSGIRGMAQVLIAGTKPNDTVQADLIEVEKAAARCQLIIKNLLGFSEPAGQPIEAVDMAELVKATLPLLKVALRDYQVSVQTDGAPRRVAVKSGEIQQVIFNLINNAVQAMPTGGQIELFVGAEKGNVTLEISDTGPGIPKEIQKRIFEPFFTTKEVGLGTGLGLSISKSIVEKYGGTIKVHSRKPKGSTFVISLPESQGKA
ncbi:MAG: response regulator [Oligoflexia bacterium]|nr:response regulator [Oligoflexia bacterium]